MSSCLQKMWTTGRLDKAILLSGPNAFEQAIELARALLCLQPLKDKPKACLNCPACNLSLDIHPDAYVVEVEEDSIKIDTIRTITQHIGNKPVVGSKRVFLIKDANKLNLAASNALLKAVEEPIEGDYFIFSALSNTGLIPPLLSRLQEIPLLDTNTELEIAAIEEPVSAMLKGTVKPSTVISQLLKQDLREVISCLQVILYKVIQAKFIASHKYSLTYDSLVNSCIHQLLNLFDKITASKQEITVIAVNKELLLADIILDLSILGAENGRAKT